MPASPTSPRILIVSPEVTYLPDRMGSLSNYLMAKGGGLADVSAALVKALSDQGADVHIALPDFRNMFKDRKGSALAKEHQYIRKVMPDDRVHLAQDRAFYYADRVYSNCSNENTKLSVTFQREVINNILPRVRPDLIHCNDWMTGLIPAMSRQLNIPCLFTIHNIHTYRDTLDHIEDRGVDAAYFWQNLFFMYMAENYETARSTNPVDFLVSGVFAAHFVNTVSLTFLEEIVHGYHDFISPALRGELINKVHAECAVGILNAPDPSFNPSTDTFLTVQYSAEDHHEAKKENKLALQKHLGLIEDENAPLFFWPSRLDPVQKGCQLLAEIFYGMISNWWEQNLQVVFVADGEYQYIFRNIVAHHGFYDRVAVCHYDESLEHRGYAASDFILMPSRFEPCGLPQMIAPLYGSLPVAHNTGGIHDTIVHLDAGAGTGNGFLFDYHDAAGLYWAVDQAVQFFNQPDKVKGSQIERIMRQSAATFTHAATARRYIALYEKMLQRPLLPNQAVQA